MNDLYGYVALYNSQRKELYASSLYEAKQKALKLFNLPSRGPKSRLVSIVLAEKNGEVVIQTAT